ncbi:hypothetical protein SCH4B_4374 [Ruegeria sp. TrichCH4B]|nr:hypothetical protein SCH4B_4374 [Ruegeria sp. TrichCH4B]
MASEGKEVRLAHDGPSVSHDELIGQLEARIREEMERKSDAGESGAKLKEFLDETGLNGQAVGWAKSILKKLGKKNGQQKAMDIVRSLEVLTPMVKNHVGGQGTSEMDLPNPNEEPEQDKPKKAKPAGKNKPKNEPATIPAEEQPEDAETAEFNAEVDDAMGEGDAVEPFDPDAETPIDFGGEDNAA